MASVTGCLPAALSYAKRGWRVVILWGPREGGCQCSRGKSCPAAGKHPMFPNWVETATCDEARIREWYEAHPGANVGLLTGPSSGITVLDIDGAEGEQALHDAGYELPETLEVKTRRGRHLYYAAPGYDLPSKIGHLPKVDLSSNARQVVAPPSVHPSGHVYAFVDEAIEVAPAPSWFRGLQKASDKAADGGERAPVRLDEPLTQGDRNVQLFRIAALYRAQGLDQRRIRALLEIDNKNCVPGPVPDGELDDIAKSVMRYEPGASLLMTEAPEYVLAAEAARLKSLGVSAKVVEQASQEMSQRMVSAPDTSKMEVELTRRTAGPGYGALFNLTVYYGGQIVHMTDLPAAKLEVYQAIRLRCIEEGVLLPKGKRAAEGWDDMIAEALRSAKVEKRGRSEDPLTASIDSAERFIAGLSAAENERAFITAADSRYLDMVGGDIGISGDALWRHVALHVPDAKRGHIARAFIIIGLREAVIKLGDRRARVRRLPREQFKKLKSGGHLYEEHEAEIEEREAARADTEGS